MKRRRNEPDAGVVDLLPNRLQGMHTMNTIAKLIAPAALVLAAFGAQASEITTGDIGAQAVKGGSTAAVQITGPVGVSGEVAVGDLGLQPVTATRADRVTRDTMAQPIRSLFAIGA